MSDSQSIDESLSDARETATSGAASVQQLESALAEKSAELAKAGQDFEQFASIVSHDLRSPLLSLTGCVELLVEQFHDQLGSEAEELLGFIRTSTNRLNDMIKGLLEYSRASSKPFSMSQCNLEEVLAPIVRELTAKEKGKVTITHDPLPTVHADASRMNQLLSALMDNALKFHGEQPAKIHVSAKQAGDNWELSVSDNGIGIEPQHLERIFNVFQRLHGESDGYSGTGVGLPIARKIAERHGGRVWAESTAGQGSTFRFTLPV